MVALEPIMPYCDKISGDVEFDSWKTLVEMLELAFRHEDGAATAKQELLKLMQKDHGFSQYYAKLPTYVPDINWNRDAQDYAL
jgi:hypothetical protein